MAPIFSTIAELVVLIFNILIFAQLITLKKDCLLSRLIMYIGSALCLGLFAYVVYIKLLPEGFASFLLVTLPTFCLYFTLSKYKDARFFVTFCFLDTVTLILTFFSRAIHIWFGNIAGNIAYIILCATMVMIYLYGTPWFCQYRELTRNVRKGWGALAVSTLLVYLLLIFSASYPAPMIQRPDFLITYAFISVTILSFYVVCLSFISQKKALADMNETLINEKKWHDMAYIDAVTGLKNRMAYIEHTNSIQRRRDTAKEIYAIVLDLDKFKKINDTFGHHFGDTILKEFANFLLQIFHDEHYSVFRIGGDEFAIIAAGITNDTLEQKLQQLMDSAADLKYSFSYGHTRVNFEKLNAMENALIEADRLMYQHKESKAKATAL